MDGLTLLIWIVVIGTAVWVGFDAGSYKHKHGVGPNKTSPAAWIVGTLLLWIIVFPWYLFARGKAPRRQASAAAAGGGSSGAFCPQCGAEFQENDAFCRKCGQARG